MHLIDSIKNKKIRFYFVSLIIYSLIIRAISSLLVELGNDEVNYWLYAVYPDLSHFDHPPMIGDLINIFTLNLTFQSEFFIRLASIIIGVINTILIFLIARKLKDETAGFYSALLYNASIYCFVIAGIFIMPDTPLILFWLITILLLINSILLKDITKSAKINLILARTFIGFAILSE